MISTLALTLPVLADAGGAIGGIVFVLVIFAIAVAATIQNIICICGPNEVLVLSGRRRMLNGRDVGYRVIKGSVAYRVPLFEVVDRMDLTNMQIEVEVKGAYSKGGIPLNVQGVANVKIAGESPALDNALQRFLGKPRQKIMQIAKETLEGNLRGVLATLTPEEVNGEKEKFSVELQKEAEEGLHKLGLTLDTLKIQNVSDDSGYLNSTGRKQSAEITKNARIAEATNKAQSLIQSAKNKQEAELARLEAELSVARAESERRVRNAETMQQALVAEQQGQVAALVARATAELKLQEARVEQMKNKLAAEVVAPATAQCEADIQKARGDAANIVENGRATAQALTGLAEQWRKMGPKARDIFLLQKLDQILPIYLSSIKDLKVEKVAMLQSGAGGANQVVSGLEALKAGTGVDLVKAFSRWAGVPSQGEGEAIADEAVAQMMTPPPAPAPSPPEPREPRKTRGPRQ